MKKTIYSIVILTLILISISSVYAIDSLACVPSLVAQGGSIECEADLAEGVTEKNVGWNMTFYNDTAQTVIINSCTFSATTENAPDPISVIQGCSIPSDYGTSTTAVVNFTIAGGDTQIFQFNISATSSVTLLINEFSFETPILMGKLTGVRWTVSKQDTGKAVLGATCTGDLLQLKEGNLVPVAGSTGGLASLLSKFAGHALTSFTPTVDILEEGTNYIVEVRCDCIPENGGCIDEDGNVLVNRSSSSGLIGIGTSSISVATWLTVNTVVDKTSYIIGEEILVSANVTNPANRSRQNMRIHQSIRCDSGDDSNLNRVVIGEHTEFRGIDSNTTQMQGHNFRIPDFEVIEKGATNCIGATEVTVLNELFIPLVTYSTRTNAFNITTSRIHPIISWNRESRNVYSSNVSFNAFDVGVKNVEVTINSLLMDTGTQASDIKNFTVLFMNGTAVPYTLKLSVHERFVKTTELDESVQSIEVITISIKNVNTTLDENFNVTIELVDFRSRSTVALEGIENKTGTFHFDVDCPPTAPIGEEMDCAITGFIEETQLVEKEVDITCWIQTPQGRVSSSNFNQMINRTSQTFHRKFMILEDLAPSQQYVLQCEAGYYNLGSRIDSFFDTFLVTEFQDGNRTVGAPSLPVAEDDVGIVEKIKEKIIEIRDEGLPLYLDIIIAGVVVLLIIFVIVLIIATRKKKRNND